MQSEYTVSPSTSYVASLPLFQKTKLPSLFANLSPLSEGVFLRIISSPSGRINETVLSALSNSAFIFSPPLHTNDISITESEVSSVVWVSLLVVAGEELFEVL